MNTSAVLHARVRSFASHALPAALAVLAACSGNSEPDQTTSPLVIKGGSGPDPAASDSATSPDVGDGEAGTCVDIEPSPAELTCATDSDCALVVTGSVCPGYVPTVGSKLGTLCENGVANSSGVARITAQIAAIPHGNDAGRDFCNAIPGTPRCLQGQCTDCTLGNSPPGCLDAGH